MRFFFPWIKKNTSLEQITIKNYMYSLHADQTNHKAQFSEHLTFERMYVFMETLNLPFRVASKI